VHADQTERADAITNDNNNNKNVLLVNHAYVVRPISSNNILLLQVKTVKQKSAIGICITSAEWVQRVTFCVNFRDKFK